MRFDEWLQQQGTSLAEFASMPPQQQSDLLLRWHQVTSFDGTSAREAAMGGQKPEADIGGPEDAEMPSRSGQAGIAAGLAAGTATGLAGAAAGGTAALLTVPGVNLVLIIGTLIGGAVMLAVRKDEQAKEYDAFLSQRGIEPLDYDGLTPDQKRNLETEYMRSPGAKQEAIQRYDAKIEEVKVANGIEPTMSKEGKSWLKAFREMGEARHVEPHMLKWTSEWAGRNLGAVRGVKYVSARTESGMAGVWSEGGDDTGERWIYDSEQDLRPGDLALVARRVRGALGRTHTIYTYAIIDAQGNVQDLTLDVAGQKRAMYRVEVPNAKAAMAAVGTFGDDAVGFFHWLQTKGQDPGWFLGLPEQERAAVYQWYSDGHEVNLAGGVPVEGRRADMVDVNGLRSAEVAFRVYTSEQDELGARGESTDPNVQPTGEQGTDTSDIEGLQEGEEADSPEFFAMPSPEQYLETANNALIAFMKADLGPMDRSPGIRLASSDLLADPNYLGSISSRTLRILQRHLTLAGLLDVNEYMEMKRIGMLGTSTPATVQALATAMAFATGTNMAWEDWVYRAAMSGKEHGGLKALKDGTGTSTTKAPFTAPAFNKMGEEDVNSFIRSAYQSSVGRDPTKAELNAMKGRYRAAERASYNQQVAAARAAYDGGGGGTVERTSSPENVVSEALYGSGEEMDYRGIRLGLGLKDLLRSG